MRDLVVAALEEHVRVGEALLRTLVPRIEDAASALVACLRAGGKVLAMGNGGSAADAQHFVAELVGRYKRERRALPAIALTTDTSILTAVANDYGFGEVFARQVRAHARAGDVVVGLSTSGNSDNVLRGLAAAAEIGAVPVFLGGGSGGKIASVARIALIVPSSDTPRIQEAHATILHVLCDVVDAGLAS